MDFKILVESTSSNLEEVLNENSDSKVMRNVNDVLQRFSKKVKLIAYRNKVDIEPSIESLRSEVSKIALDMKNGKFKSKKKTTKFMDFDIKKYMKDSKETFKDEYISELLELISSLDSLSKQVSWMDVREIITPFLELECTEKEIKEDINFLVALNEDELVRDLYKILNEAEEDKGKPSLKPPKEWIDKLKRKMQKSSPDYSMERILRTIGDIWYHKLDKAKKSEIRNRYGKVYGEALKEVNESRKYLVTVDELRIGPNDIKNIGTEAVSKEKAFNNVMYDRFMRGDKTHKASYKEGIYDCGNKKHYKMLLDKIGSNYKVTEA